MVFTFSYTRYLSMYVLYSQHLINPKTECYRSLVESVYKEQIFVPLTFANFWERNHAIWYFQIGNILFTDFFPSFKEKVVKSLSRISAKFTSIQSNHCKHSQKLHPHTLERILHMSYEIDSNKNYNIVENRFPCILFGGKAIKRKGLHVALKNGYRNADQNAWLKTCYSLNVSKSTFSYC